MKFQPYLGIKIPRAPKAHVVFSIHKYSAIKAEIIYRIKAYGKIPNSVYDVPTLLIAHT
jgi:hypothetical protein